MKKTGKILGWVLIAVVAIVTIWFLFFRNKAIAAVPAVTDSAVIDNDSFPLKKGSKGDRVRSLQAALNSMLDFDYVPVATIEHPDKLVIDGVFGQKTETVLNYLRGVTQVDQELFYNLTGGK